MVKVPRSAQVKVGGGEVAVKWDWLRARRKNIGIQPKQCSKNEAAKRKQVARLLGIEQYDYDSGMPTKKDVGYTTKLVGGPCDSNYVDVGYGDNETYQLLWTIPPGGKDPITVMYKYKYQSVGVFVFVEQLPDD